MTEIDIPAAMDEAAEFIAQPGNFGKGDFKQGDRFCTLGAFAKSLGISIAGDAFNWESGTPLTNAFHEGWDYLDKTTEIVSGRGISVNTMNDILETTAEEMAAVLKMTAQRLRSVAA